MPAFEIVFKINHLAPRLKTLIGYTLVALVLLFLDFPLKSNTRVAWIQRFYLAQCLLACQHTNVTTLVLVSRVYTLGFSYYLGS